MASGVPIEGDFHHYYRVSINLSKVPSDRLEKLQRIATAKFYLRPVRLIRFAARVPHFWKRSFEMFLIFFLAVIGKWKK